MDTAPAPDDARDRTPSSEVSDRAAELRDVAATARDDAANARDVVSAGPDTSSGARDQAAQDRESAAQDRAEAAQDRAEWAVRAAAAEARDTAAEARDAAAAAAADTQRAGDRMLAASDRAASANDRHEAALDRHGAADHLQQAYRDDLTGLLLRDAGRDHLGQAFARARRLGEPLVLAFLDVDDLKSANDRDGHEAGDDLLRAVGAALREGVRSYDVLVRHGGDEFLCAFVGSHLAEAEHRLADVSAAVSRAVPGASFSFGLAELGDDPSIEDMIGRADTDMYARRAARAAPDEPAFSGSALSDSPVERGHGDA